MTEDSDYLYLDTVYFDIKDFLSEYETHPCLWDKRHELFKDRIERLKAEEIFCEKMGFTDLRMLRRKIRSVRGTYNTEIRKIKASLECGDEVYIPKLSWFKMADKFLRVTTDIPAGLDIPQSKTVSTLPKFTSKLKKLPRRSAPDIVIMKTEDKSKTNRPLQSQISDDWSETIERLDEDAFDDEEVLEKNSSINTKIKTEAASDSTSTTENELYFVSDPQLHQDNSDFKQRKRKLHKTRDSKAPSLTDVMKSLKDITQANENEFAAFGRSVGVQLQNLPLEIALQLQTDIQAHITRTRLDYLMNIRGKNSD